MRFVSSRRHTWAIRVVFVFSLLGSFVGCATAQGNPRSLGEGTLGDELMPGVRYMGLERVEGEGRTARAWLSFVVLWRHSVPAPGAAMRADVAPLASRTAEVEHRRLRCAAEDEGRWLLGGVDNGVLYSATYDPRTQQVQSAGMTFPVPARDSALVVLVDARGGQPTVVGTAYIPSAPEVGLRPVTWISGDTTFIVQPPRGQREAALAAKLRAVPAVRRFLE